MAADDDVIYLDEADDVIYLDQQDDDVVYLDEKKEPGLLDFATGLLRTTTPLSETEHEAFKEYGPSVVSGLAGLATGGLSTLGQMATGLVLGRGAAGLTAYLRGRDVSDAVMDPVGAGLEAGIPAVGGVVKHFAKGAEAAAPAVKTAVEYPTELLDDAGWKATGSAAAAPKAVPEEAFKDTAERLAATSKELTGHLPVQTPRQDLETRFLAPRRLIERTDKAAALTLRENVRTPRMLRATYGPRIREIFRGLTPEERKQVTELREGLIPDAPERIRVASERLTKEFYEPLAEAAETAGVVTKRESGELVPFTRKAGDYSPWREVKEETATRTPWHGRIRRQRTAYSRTAEGQSPERIMDAGQLAKMYLGEYAPLIGRARAFGGGSIDLAVPGTTTPWGPKAVETYHRLIKEGKTHEAALYESALNKAYSTSKPSPGLQNWASRANTAVLGLSSLTNVPQLSAAVGRYGPINTVRGLSRYARDPKIRQAVRESGAFEPGWAAYLGEEAQAAPGYRALSWLEGKLRGPLNAGVVPYVEKLQRNVQKGRMTGAMQKQLDELGLSASDLQGPISDDLWSTIYQESANRTQNVVGVPGESGEFWQDPAGKFLSGVASYPFKQWGVFRDDTLSPMWQGAKRGDASLVMLGAGRLGKAAGSAEVLAQGIEGINSQLSGRDYDPWNAHTNALTTVAGIPGGIAQAVRWGRNPALDLLPPALSVPGGVVMNASRGKFGPAAYDTALLAAPPGVRNWMALGRRPAMGMMRGE